jgi:hypothetical protein
MPAYGVCRVVFDAVAAYSESVISVLVRCGVVNRVCREIVGGRIK